MGSQQHSSQFFQDLDIGCASGTKPTLSEQLLRQGKFQAIEVRARYKYVE